MRVGGGADAVEFKARQDAGLNPILDINDLLSFDVLFLNGGTLFFASTAFCIFQVPSKSPLTFPSHLVCIFNGYGQNPKHKAAEWIFHVELHGTSSGSFHWLARLSSCHQLKEASGREV
jgi:hypothetical protein